LDLNPNWWFGMILDLSDSDNSILNSIFKNILVSVGKIEIGLKEDGISGSLSGFGIKIMFECYQARLLGSKINK